jgi:hypothetical protein
VVGGMLYKLNPVSHPLRCDLCVFFASVTPDRERKQTWGAVCASHRERARPERERSSGRERASSRRECLCLCSHGHTALPQAPLYPVFPI